jgi:hypothetical protein
MLPNPNALAFAARPGMRRCPCVARESTRLGAALLGHSRLVLVSLLLTGCVLGLDSRGPARAGKRPPPRAETPAPRPRDCGRGCVYRPGYWHFQGGGYAWVEGGWEREAGVVVDSTR